MLHFLLWKSSVSFVLGFSPENSTLSIFFCLTGTFPILNPKCHVQVCHLVVIYNAIMLESDNSFLTTHIFQRVQVTARLHGDLYRILSSARGVKTKDLKCCHKPPLWCCQGFSVPAEKPLSVCLSLSLSLSLFLYLCIYLSLYPISLLLSGV